MKSKELGLFATIMVIIGAINWGFVGAFKFDLVQTLFGSVPVIAQFVYILVGLSGLYMLYMFTFGGKKKKK